MNFLYVNEFAVTITGIVIKYTIGLIKFAEKKFPCNVASGHIFEI